MYSPNPLIVSDDRRETNWNKDLGMALLCLDLERRVEIQHMNEFEHYFLGTQK